jgi:hypothetical protein
MVEDQNHNKNAGSGSIGDVSVYRSRPQNLVTLRESH